MNNPASILKLWIKAIKMHETDKDPKKMPQKGQEQKTKIKNGLTTLKAKGAAAMASPANAPQFLTVRDQAGKAMTRMRFNPKYCICRKTPLRPQTGGDEA